MKGRRKDGTEVESHGAPRRRPSGARLSRAEVLQIRDSLYAVLTDDLGVSPADALRVGESMALHRSHLLRRRQESAAVVQQCGGGLRLLFTVACQAGYK